MPIAGEQLIEFLDKNVIPMLVSTEDHTEKRRILGNIQYVLPATFYIDYPGTKQAEKLYQIASECAQVNNGTPVTNGDIWKILMPSLLNTETACRFPLPGYDDRQSLIITSNLTHLLSIPEMSKTCGSDLTLDSLPNLHNDCGLTFSEQTQVSKKDYDLWCKYYNRGEPWLSQLTFEKLVFIVNISLSSKDVIDGNFESKFENGLLEDTDFKRFYQENFEKTVSSIKGIHDRNDLKLTACYKYFESYFKTLPQSEQAAFKLIQLKNRNLYETLISINAKNQCMTMTAYYVSDFVFALTSDKNREKWKYDLINERQRFNHDIIGTMQHMVREPLFVPGLLCVAGLEKISIIANKEKSSQSDSPVSQKLPLDHGAKLFSGTMHLWGSTGTKEKPQNADKEVRPNGFQFN